MISVEIPELNISYKPQKISPKFTGTVRDLLNSKIRESIFHPQFQTDVSRPLQIDNIIDNEVCARFFIFTFSSYLRARLIRYKIFPVVNYNELLYVYVWVNLLMSI